MNILLIHQYFLEEDGAGGSRFNEMAEIWTLEGHNVTVLAGMMPDVNGKKLACYKNKKIVFRKQGLVKVYRCHVNEAYNKNYFGRVLGYFSFLFYSFWAGLFMIKDNPDLILFTSPPIMLGIPAFLFSRIKKVPLVFEVRDLWPESAIDTGVLKNKCLIKLMFMLENILYKKSKLICVLTPAFKNVLINNKKVDPSKIIYIPNGSDFKITDQMISSYDPFEIRNKRKAEDKFVIVYVGAHGLANGLHQILDTAELLQDTNVVFWLIGKGMKRNELINDAQKKGLKNIEFIDPIPKPEIFKYILSADMGTSVLTNNNTFKTVYSNKTFDYMSCKKPVLLAIDGISRVLIEEADAGVFIEPENPKDFEKKIRFYLNNPDLVKRQGLNGYLYAKEKFDRKKLAKSYLEYLQELVT